jgi:hypothetical protein
MTTGKPLASTNPARVEEIGTCCIREKPGGNAWPPISRMCRPSVTWIMAQVADEARAVRAASRSAAV